MTSNDKPAFEVINPQTGEAFRIWADGRTEGFEKYGATLIVNRIPQMIARQQYEASLHA